MLPDPFRTNMFSMASLTTAINKVPDVWNMLARLGIFREEGVTTRTVLVESQNGILHMLPQRPIGGPSSLNVTGGRKLQAFMIPHFPHDDAVLPEAVQGVRMFGSDNALETVANVVGRKLTNMRQKHSLTHEFMRLGAIKGIVKDGENQVVYDLFTQFGITQKVIDTNLDTATSKPNIWMSSLKTYVEQSLRGESMSGLTVLCSPTFFDALTGNDFVIDAFKFYQTTQPLSGDYRRGFEYFGITWISYPYAFPDVNGNAILGIEDGAAYVVPTGTQNTFVMYYAPADFNETVNTIGLPIYAKSEERQYGRGVNMHTQSNPLPLCLRPELLVKLTV